MSEQDAAVALLREVHKVFSPTFGVGKSISEKHQQGAMIDKVEKWLKAYDAEEQPVPEAKSEQPVQVELQPRNEGVKVQPKGIQVMLEPLHIEIGDKQADVMINNENNPIVRVNVHRHSKASNAEVFAWLEKLATIVE